MLPARVYFWPKPLVPILMHLKDQWADPLTLWLERGSKERILSLLQ